MHSNPLQELVDVINERYQTVRKIELDRVPRSDYGYRFYIVHTPLIVVGGYYETNSVEEVVTTYYGKSWEDIWNQLMEDEE